MKITLAVKIYELIVFYILFLFLINNRSYNNFDDLLMNTFKFGSIYDFLFTFIIFILLIIATLIIEFIFVFIYFLVKNIEKKSYKYFSLLIFRFCIFFILCNVFEFLFWHYFMST